MFKSGLICAAVAVAAAPGVTAQVLSGAAAFGDWRDDAPGVLRRLTPADLPKSTSTPSALPPAVVPRPPGAALKVPPGFSVAAFAELKGPRQIRVTPGGDIFVAETNGGRIKVLRAADGAAAPRLNEVFAEGLDRPFGIAFYPSGPDPHWVYVANANSVVRFPYRNGDLKARGPAEPVVDKLTAAVAMHSTRDIAFSTDDKVMYVSVGSGSNDAETMPRKTAAEAQVWDQAHGTGAAWGKEEGHADVLAFDPQGRGRSVYAAGLRNCVSVALDPATKALWCAVNERDSLGDNLPADYVTRVRSGGFYGWPWFYIGDNENPEHKGERPDLTGKVIVPDVLIQPHSAPLGIAFYPSVSGPAAFPASYRGDAFVTLHGSWNRAKRTGYKLVRVPMRNGVPTGLYEDFLVGFVVNDRSVWGRPVGVAVAHDGALLVTDDASNTVWRISRARGTS
jgi:glucose/arabinose dehydrogenase